MSNTETPKDTLSVGFGLKAAMVVGVGIEAGTIIDPKGDVYIYVTGPIGVGVQTPSFKGSRSLKQVVKATGGPSVASDDEKPLTGISDSTTVDIAVGVVGSYDLDDLNSSGKPNAWGWGGFGGGVWKNKTYIWKIKR